MQAFKARVQIHSQGTLLGGAPIHESWPFESVMHAEQWAETCIAVNKDRDGYRDADIRFNIVPVQHKNPIRIVELGEPEDEYERRQRG